MQDFLGQEYGPGDWVLYSRGYGCSGSQMLLAEVVRVNPTTVIAIPLKGSRSTWKPTRLIDSRTGKGIWPYNKTHIKKESHYRHKETGEERDFRTVPSWRDPGRKDWEDVRTQYWEYVTEAPAHITLYITDNIVKVDKEALANAVQKKS